MKLLGMSRVGVNAVLESLTHVGQAGFGRFDCDSCAKHLSVPECRACDRMVNYFKVFRMYSCMEIDQRTIRLIRR